jgi:hypothetical protein
VSSRCRTATDFFVAGDKFRFEIFDVRRHAQRDLLPKLTDRTEANQVVQFFLRFEFGQIAQLPPARCAILMQLAEGRPTMATRFIALCCWLFCAHACADAATEKLALAERLTKLTGTEAVYQSYFDECGSKTVALDMAAVGYREHPEAFGGLSPDSAYWKEVEAIYSRYHGAMCGDTSARSIAQLFTSQYVAQMSNSELRAAIDFYSSPAGQLLVKVDMQTNGKVQEKLASLEHAVRAAAEDQYQRDIAALIKKFQSDPSARP